MDNDLMQQTKAKMNKALEALREDLGTIRTGRATPALVENIVISAYEGTQKMKIREMATITTEGARMLLVAPFDPSTIQDLEKGINTANLGFSAATDGSVIRISIPSLTAERRDEFIKLAHAKIEGGRVMIRQIRHEMMHAIKLKFDHKEISEDDKKRMDKEVQTATDEMMEEIDGMRQKKEAELTQL